MSMSLQALVRLVLGAKRSRTFSWRTLGESQETQRNEGAAPCARSTVTSTFKDLKAASTRNTHFNFHYAMRIFLTSKTARARLVPKASFRVGISERFPARG
jgi:ABC-type ATPase involved in cell division